MINVFIVHEYIVKTKSRRGFRRGRSRRAPPLKKKKKKKKGKEKKKKKEKRERERERGGGERKQGGNDTFNKRKNVC